jgi:hypothetical protein
MTEPRIVIDCPLTGSRGPGQGVGWSNPTATRSTNVVFVIPRGAFLGVANTVTANAILLCNAEADPGNPTIEVLAVCYADLAARLWHQL